MDQASSSAEVPHDMLYPEVLGLPGNYNFNGNLHAEDETATLCGMKLNHEGIPSGVKDTVIGGIISVGQYAWAMTSKRSHDKASYPYWVKYQSKTNSDWALCDIIHTLEVPNVNGSTRLIHYKKEADLPWIPGTVKVLAGRGEEFEAHLSTGDGWGLGAFRGVKLIGLITQLPKETIIPRGAWVVKDDSLCGYVVHCEPGTNGRVGYMAPIEQAFKEMKKIFKGKEPCFPNAPPWTV